MVRRLALLAATAILGGAGATTALADPVPPGPLFTVVGANWRVAPQPRGALATDAFLPGIEPYTTPGAMLERPDGSLLVAYGSRVWRVGPGGHLRLFAGGRSHGRGPQPTNVCLGGGVSDLASLPDGSVLLAVPSRGLVLRVDPAGHLHPAVGRLTAGCAPPPFAPRGDGGPATSARLDTPVDLAVLPDGGYLVADTGDGSIRRVLPDGTIRTRLWLHPLVFGSMAVTTDGSLLIAEGWDEDTDPGSLARAKVVRINPDGTRSIAAQMPLMDLLPAQDGGFVGLRVRLPEADATEVVAVSPQGEVTPVAGGGQYTFSGVASGIDPFAADLRGCQLARPADGGLLVSECVGPYALARVRYLAPAVPGRLAIGIAAGTLSHTDPQQIVFTLSQPATATVEVTAPGRPPWSTQVQAVAGTNTVELTGVEVPPAAQVRVTATAAGARPATVSDSVRVRWGGTLSTDASTAVRALYPKDYDRPTDRSCRTEEGCTYLDCRQMTATRVDCGETFISSDSGRRPHCHGIVAVRLQPDGSLTGRLYDWTAIEDDHACRFRLNVEDPGIDHDYYVVGWSDVEMPLLG